MLDAPADQSTLIERLVGALRLDLRLYQQVSTDAAATRQAVTVVLLSGVCNSLGWGRQFGMVGIAAAVTVAVLGWLLWAVVILLVARILGHHRGGRSLLRVLGFANAPAVLMILSVVPIVGAVVRVLVVVWLVATTAAAVQAVFDVSRRRALVISIVGFVAYMMLGVVSGHLAAS